MTNKTVDPVYMAPQTWIKRFLRARGISSLDELSKQERATVYAMQRWLYAPEYAAKRLDDIMEKASG